MSYNNATLIRRSLLTRICKMLFDDTLEESIDRLPYDMCHREDKPIRCCVHKDRAVVKYQTMAVLGFNVSDETDEATPLSEYAKRAIDRTEFTDVMMTVVDEACSSCIRVNYAVTNFCRLCVGHPCTFACKQGAITLGSRQAEINPEKCVNCGMCMQACPFNAIIFQPVPCEAACPVGAIYRNEKGVQEIDEEKCIYCGRCKDACPYGAVMEKTYLVQIIRAMREGKRVVAMVAPAIMGQFSCIPEQIMGSIKQTGFSDVIEVAKGANTTSSTEAAEFEERMERGDRMMTTSCCYAYTRLVERYIPELKPFVSDTRTPVHYTAEMVKKEDPECVSVFIAPCVSKRHESFYDENIDYVMSFEALLAMFEAKGIEMSQSDPIALDPDIDYSGRAFPYTGGVAESVQHYAKNPESIKPMIIDGIDRAAIRTLRGLAKKSEGINLVEVMACPGGCVGGCDTLMNPKMATRQIKKLAQPPKE